MVVWCGWVGGAGLLDWIRLLDALHIRVARKDFFGCFRLRGCSLGFPASFTKVTAQLSEVSVGLHKNSGVLL